MTDSGVAWRVSWDHDNSLSLSQGWMVCISHLFSSPKLTVLYELKCQTPIFLQYFYKIWAPGLVTQHQLLAARDVTERVMLWTSYVSPVMSHHDSSKHQPDTKTHIPLSANQKQILCHEISLSQWEDSIVSWDPCQPLRGMCRQIRCFVWCNWGQTRHAEQRNLFSEYWWWLFTRQFIQTHFHHKIL